MAAAVVPCFVTVAVVDVGVEDAVFDDAVLVARETSDEEWELSQSADCGRCSNKVDGLGHDRGRAKVKTQDMNWVGCIEAYGSRGSWRRRGHGERSVGPCLFFDHLPVKSFLFG